VLDGKRWPLLATLMEEKTSGGTLIFTNTREQCDTLAAQFDKNKVKCAVYRGEMDKTERRANLKAFRDGEIAYLISTDLASRGLDVEHVGRVINYHMPQQLENYIHRVGRTARAGRSGVVINFITERDAEILAQLETVRSSRV
jgi:ATP-dependent RNA helicase RhlE